jgi:hypothetical protein
MASGIALGLFAQTPNWKLLGKGVVLSTTFKYLSDMVKNMKIK